MRDDFSEYCELFAYFGRGGAERLTRAAFEACAAEFRALEALRPRLSAAQADRLIDLRDLLLRDLPKITVLQRELRCASPKVSGRQKTKPKLK